MNRTTRNNGLLKIGATTTLCCENYLELLCTRNLMCLPDDFTVFTSASLTTSLLRKGGGGGGLG